MNNYSCEEKEFINGVWNKVRYLEQMRIEEEIIIKNKRNVRKKQTVSAFTSLTTSILLLSPLLINKISIGTALLYAGLVLLGCGIIYEHLLYTKNMEV